MQRRRFYSPPDQFTGTDVLLSREETHHLLRVLRLAPGDIAYVFDGCGSEYRCRFADLEGDRARLDLLEGLKDSVESPVRITLAQALAKGEKFDLLVQKATELGVNEIVPLVTINTDLKLLDERTDRRLERWQRISLEALKQSGRRTLVEIRRPARLRDYLLSVAAAGITDGRPSLLVFNETGGVPIGRALEDLDRQRIIALVGPEGGWGPEEIDFMGGHAVSVTLGPRILRTETAGISAVALIQHRVGDLSR
jgi:16S rRNA (uracil1498-N3)-methyltransferase